MGLRKRTYLEEANGKHVGYKVMRVQGGRLVSGADSRQAFPMRKGAVIRMSGLGVYLSPNKQYVLDYYSGLADDEVLLSLEFFDSDITWGNLTDRESEVAVRQARIIGIKHLED